MSVSVAIRVRYSVCLWQSEIRYLFIHSGDTGFTSPIVSEAFTIITSYVPFSNLADLSQEAIGYILHLFSSPASPASPASSDDYDMR